jgi:hypothetical protein
MVKAKETLYLRLYKETQVKLRLQSVMDQKRVQLLGVQQR